MNNVDIALIAQEAMVSGYRVLPYDQHKRIERLPVVEWWDVSPSRDGSQRLCLYRGRRNFYVQYWANHLVDGDPVDWCVVIPKQSALGQQLADLIRGQQTTELIR